VVTSSAAAGFSVISEAIVLRVLNRKCGLT
jgi:hypothetical protein